MAHIELPEGTDPERQRMWKLVPDMYPGVTAMGSSIFDTTSLTVRERELARMRIAEINACPI